MKHNSMIEIINYWIRDTESDYIIVMLQISLSPAEGAGAYFGGLS
jgi:hypothetical protein